MRRTWMLALVLAPSACRSTPPPADFAARIERAHNLTGWRAHQALQVRVQLESGGQTRFDAVFVFDTPLGKSRFTTEAAEAVFDGRTAWVTPSDAELPRARFQLLTWPYFIAAPMKLSDPGTHLSPLGDRPFDGLPLPAAKLTFDNGVGDTPEDWYIVYRAPTTDRLRALAYIVTFGKTAEQAEATPHVASYEAWTTVDGVLLPTRISIHDWRSDQGMVGAPLTTVLLSEHTFVPFDPQRFEKPTDAREEPLPAH